MHADSQLRTLIDEYILKNQRLKQSTHNWLRTAWSHLIPAVGEMAPTDFGHNQAEDFVAYLYKLDLAPSSIKGYIKAVQMVLNWAWRRGYREGDSFNQIRKPRIPKRDIRVFSNAELYDILAAASMIQRRAMIMTAVTAGLRRSEILNLTIKDVDFSDGHIKVQSKNETAFTWAYTTKSYECRRLPLVDDLANLLTRILADEIPPGQPYFFLTEKRYWYLQQVRQQGQMSERVKTCPDQNWRWFKKLLVSLGIEGTFHDLRRTCITRWTLPQWNLPIQEVQWLAGHADIKTTLEYYAGVRADVIQRAKESAFGATGLEPATS